MPPLQRAWYSPAALWQRKTTHHCGAFPRAHLALRFGSHAVNGAIPHEIIDVLAVLNALRAAFPPKVIHDLSTHLSEASPIP